MHRIVGRLRVHLLFYTINGSYQQGRTMPPRYAFRLEDLRVFHQVRATCHACGRKSIIPNATLLQGGPVGHGSFRSNDNCGAENVEREARPHSTWNFGRVIEIQDLFISIRQTQIPMPNNTMKTCGNITCGHRRKATSERVRLSALRGDPVGLVFGSYT